MLTRNQRLTLRQNHLQNPVKILHHLNIPKANNVISLLFQPGRAFCVIFFLEGVAIPIYFDNEPCFMAIKIHDVCPQWLLPPKPEATQLFAPKVLPQAAFWFGWLLAHLAGVV